MKPFESIKLQKPLISDVSLADPMDTNENGLNYYIPVFFNPDEYFPGLSVSSNETEDYIDLYLTYYPANDSIELYFTYVNYSGYTEGEADFTVKVIIDDKTEEYLRKLLKEDDAYKWQKYILYLKEWAEEHTDSVFSGSSPMQYRQWSAQT